MKEIIDTLSNTALSDAEKQKWLNSYLADNLLNTSEAADLINVNRITIDNYVKRNLLTPLIHRPHNKVFWKSDLLELKQIVAENKKDPRGWHKQK
ncbi:hypothetical protein Y487_15150 [Listeria monocytogenes]|uniref:hypothetical protein n=1 Tax=Listeria monocytogenes TaxID=1639 RepID=UPI0010EDE9DC|nr:hypothetical protein [Listeria monocytogenes]EAC9891235.1 hypothetical protein [Listeria monocytogenes]